MTQKDLPGKQAPAEHCSIRLVYVLLLQIVLYMYIAALSHDREPYAETEKLFTLAFLLSKRQKCNDVGLNIGPIKYPPPPHAMGRPDL